MVFITAKKKQKISLSENYDRLKILYNFKWRRESCILLEWLSKYQTDMEFELWKTENKSFNMYYFKLAFLHHIRRLFHPLFLRLIPIKAILKTTYLTIGKDSKCHEIVFISLRWCPVHIAPAIPHISAIDWVI